MSNSKLQRLAETLKTSNISMDNINDPEIITGQSGKPWTRADLQEMFNRVAPETNWKNPISRRLILQNPEREIPLIKDAINFFAGCEAAVDYTHDSTLTRPTVCVSACGYYIAVGP